MAKVFFGLPRGFHQHPGNRFAANRFILEFLQGGGVEVGVLVGVIAEGEASVEPHLQQFRARVAFAPDLQFALVHEPDGPRVMGLEDRRDSAINLLQGFQITHGEIVPRQRPGQIVHRHDHRLRARACNSRQVGRSNRQRNSNRKPKAGQPMQRAPYSWTTS